MKIQRGFTLIELMVVVAIVALGTALVSLALPDGDRNALARDGARLAALLESARAQSRVAGVPVQWRPTASGFAFDGLPATAPPLPTGWLDARTHALGNAPVTLGPDPIVPAQAIVLQLAGSAGHAVGHVYETDQAGSQRTTLFKGGSVTKACWLKRGSEC